MSAPYGLEVAGDSRHPLEPWIVLAMSAVVTTIAYWPGLVGDFVNWDDSRFIYANPRFAERKRARLESDECEAGGRHGGRRVRGAAELLVGLAL